MKLFVKNIKKKQGRISIQKAVMILILEIICHINLKIILKKLFMFLLPALVFSQEDIERYKIYPTENIYTSLNLIQQRVEYGNFKWTHDDVDRVQSVLVSKSAI